VLVEARNPRGRAIEAVDDTSKLNPTTPRSLSFLLLRIQDTVLKRPPLQTEPQDVVGGDARSWESSIAKSSTYAIFI